MDKQKTYFRLEELDPVTSTPFVRKRVETVKSRRTIKQRELKVYVHDGLAMRTVTIGTADSLFSVLEKIAFAMKRPNNQVEMGYKAPWSLKINNKKSLAYISSEEELDDFWLSLDSYEVKQKAKKKASNASDIVFSNMMDNAQVNTCSYSTNIFRS